MEKQKTWLQKQRYELLFISLLILLLNSLFFPPHIVRFYILPIAIAMVYTSSYLLFWEDEMWIRNLIKSYLVILYLALFYYIFFTVNQDFRNRFDVPLSMLFYIIILVKLVKKVFKAKRVTFNLVIASISGYLVLLYIGAFLFIMIDYLYPNSFKGIDRLNPNNFDDYIYFSFITQSTTGFGDIIPISPHAKKAVILVGTAGQFYLIVLVGLMVSKFASHSDKKAEDFEDI